MPFVIVTGGLGAGKTTLLNELAAMGHAIVDESARAIIAERKARGESPRPEPAAFAREILRRDIEKYVSQPRTAEWTFFDRSLIEALGILQESSPLPSSEVESVLATYQFHPAVFVLPPWEGIYSTDEERDQTFADAVEVHGRVVQWYRSCGYTLNEVPRLLVARRAEHVLHTLTQGIIPASNPSQS